MTGSVFQYPISGAKKILAILSEWHFAGWYPGEGVLM